MTPTLSQIDAAIRGLSGIDYHPRSPDDGHYDSGWDQEQGGDWFNEHHAVLTIALRALRLLVDEPTEEMVAAFNGLSAALGTGSRTLREHILRLFSQFIAEPMDAREIQVILNELEAARPVVAPVPPEDEDAEADGDEMSAIGRIWRNGNGHG